MLYKQFLEITDKLNPDFVESFDYWLATLPTNRQENITASVVASRVGTSWSMAETILSYAEKVGILESYYIVVCPNDDCNSYLDVISKNEIATVLMEQQYCEDCDEYYQITLENIYTAYKIVKSPDVTEAEIEKAINDRLNQCESTVANFQKADSLINDKSTIYEAFYNPDESAYEKFKEMRANLDKDYGKNTTAKGNSLEELVLEIFKQIKFIKGTNEIRTKTNQFDCTVFSSMDTMFPSIFNLLYPYFIIECKNEPEKTPGNTYFNKLLAIIGSNDAKIGIVVARKAPASTCDIIAREHYLETKRTNKVEYLLSMHKDDLKYLIDDRVNLLEYLEFKINKLTLNSNTFTWQKFKEMSNTDVL